ncbi:Microtubule-associated protein futsch [Eumeta japonica]|uniref:Microtubule-associated protein futsch n=1 Tax=Eumeta variegata TaxID=151549 RepID=A0A4C1TXT1_EUMVA|nr:Microtubule-associated protein futsch [Eumeta japonica]
MPDEQTVTLPKDIETKKHVEEETKVKTEKEIQKDVEMVVKTMPETEALTETKLSPEESIPTLVPKPKDRLEESESTTADVKISLPDKDKKTDDTIKGEISKEVTVKVPEDFTKLSEKEIDETKDVIETEPPVKSVVSVVDTLAPEILKISKVEEVITKSTESTTTESIPVSDTEILKKLDIPDEQTVTLAKDIDSEKLVEDKSKREIVKEIQKDVEMVVKTMPETDALTETKLSPEKPVPDLVSKPDDRLDKSKSPTADVKIPLPVEDKKTDDTIKSSISKEVTVMVPKDTITLSEKEIDETKDVIETEPPVKSVVSVVDTLAPEILKISKVEEVITKSTESTTTESIPVSYKEIPKKLDIPDEQTVTLAKNIDSEKLVEDKSKREIVKEIQKDVEMVVKTMPETDALTETKLSPEKPVPDLVSKPDDRLDKSKSPTADVKIPLPVEDKKTDDTIKGEISKEVTVMVPKDTITLSEKEIDETKDVMETEPPIKSVVSVVDTPATEISKIPKVEEDVTKSIERVTTESIPVSDKEIPGKLDMPDEQTVTLPKDIESEKHVKEETKAETEKERQKDVEMVVKTMPETDALTETKLSPEKPVPDLVSKPDDRLEKSESPTADVKIPLPVEDKKTDDTIKGEISKEVTEKVPEDFTKISEKETDETKDVIETESPVKSVVSVVDTPAPEISKIPKVEEDVTKSIERVTTESISVSDKEIPKKLDMPDEQTVTLPKDIETEKHVKEETKAETEKEIQIDVEMIPLLVEDKNTDDTIKGAISKEVTEKVPEDFTKLSEKVTDETKDVIETESPVKSVVSVVDTPAPEISKIPKVEEDVTKSIERVTTESIPVSDKEIPEKLDMPDEQTVTLPKDIETEKHVKEETKAETLKETLKDVEMVVKTRPETDALTETKLSPEKPVPDLVSKPDDRLEKSESPTADVKIPLPVEDKKTDDTIKGEISKEVTVMVPKDTTTISEKEIDETKDVIEMESPVKSVVSVVDTPASEILKIPKVEEGITKSIESATTESIPVSDKEIPKKLDMPDEETVTLPKDIETEKYVKEETKSETLKETLKDVEMMVKTMPETDAQTETKLSPEKPVPDLVSKPDDRLEKSESPTADVKIPLPVEDKKTDDMIKSEISIEVTAKMREDTIALSEKEIDETKDVIETEPPIKSVVSVGDTLATEISKMPKVEEDVTKSIERVTTKSIPVSDKEIPGKLDMPDEQTVTLPKDIETEKHVKEETKAETEKEIQIDVEMVVKTMAETDALTETKLSLEKPVPDLVSKPDDRLEKSESPTADVKIPLPVEDKKTDDTTKGEISKEVTEKVPEDSTKISEKEIDETKDVIETEPPIKSVVSVGDTLATEISKMPKVEEDVTKSIERVTTESIPVSDKEIPGKLEMPDEQTVTLPKGIETEKHVKEETKAETLKETLKDVEMVVKTMPETDALTETKLFLEKPVPDLVSKSDDRLEKSESPTADVKIPLPVEDKKTDDTIKGEISKEVTVKVPEDFTKLSEKEIDETKDVIEMEPPVKSVVSVVDTPVPEISKIPKVEEDVTKSIERVTTENIPVSYREILESLDMADEQTVTLPKDIDSEKHFEEETKAETEKEMQQDVEMAVKSMLETDALTETKLSPEKLVPDLVSKPEDQLEKSESPTPDVKIPLPDEDKKTDDMIKGEISKEVTEKVPEDFTKLLEKEIEETKDIIETEPPVKSVVSVVDTPATEIAKVLKVEDTTKSIESATTESIPVSDKEMPEKLDMPVEQTVTLPKDIETKKHVEEETKVKTEKEIQKDVEMVVKTMPETDALTETKLSPEKSIPTLVPKPEDRLEKSESPIADVELSLKDKDKKTDDTIKGEISKEVTEKVPEDFTKLSEKVTDETKDVIEAEPPVKSVVSVVDTPATEISEIPKVEDTTKSVESATTESIPVSDKEIPEKLDMPDEQTVTLPKDIETEKHVKEETKAETLKETLKDVEMVVKTRPETDALTETKLSPEKPVPDLVSKPDDRLEKSESPTADVKIPLPVEDKKTDDTIKSSISKEVTVMVPKDTIILSEKEIDETKDVIETEPPTKSVVSVVDTPGTEISEIPKVEDTTKSIEGATRERVPVSDKKIPEKLDIPDEQTVTLPKGIETEKHVKEETKAETLKETLKDVEMVVKTRPETDALTETKLSPEKLVPDLVSKPDDRLEKSESPTADVKIPLPVEDKKTDDTIKSSISKEVTVMVPKDTITLSEKEIDETKDVIETEPPIKSVVSVGDTLATEISKMPKVEEDVTKSIERVPTESIPVSDKEIPEKLDMPGEQTVTLLKDIETEKRVKEETKAKTEKEIQKDVEMVVKTRPETDALTETKLSPEKLVPDLVSKPDDRLEKSESPTADVKIPLPVEDKKTDDTIKSSISKEVTVMVPKDTITLSEKEIDETKDVIETEPPIKSVVSVGDTLATEISKMPNVEEDVTKSIERVTTESIPVSDKEIPGKLDIPDKQTVTLPKDIETEKHVKEETKAETEKEIQIDVEMVVKTMAETDALTETKLSPEKPVPDLVSKPDDRLEKSESPTADVELSLTDRDEKTDDVVKGGISKEVTEKVPEDFTKISEKEIDETKDVIETESPVKSVVSVVDTPAPEISKIPKVEEDVTKSIERVTTESIPVSHREILERLDMPDEQTVTLPKDIETEKHVEEETKPKTEKEIQKDVEMVVKTMPETDALTETKLSPEKSIPTLVLKPEDRLEKSESPIADVELSLKDKDKKTDDTIKGEISKEVTVKVPEDFTKLSEKEIDETKDVIEMESPVKSVVSVVDTPAPEISKIPKVEEDVTKSIERVTTESIPVSHKEILERLDMAVEQTVTLPKDIETEKHVEEETKPKTEKEIQKDVEMVVKTMPETDALTETKLSPEKSIPTLVLKPEDRLEKSESPIADVELSLKDKDKKTDDTIKGDISKEVTIMVPKDIITISEKEIDETRDVIETESPVKSVVSVVDTPAPEISKIPKVEEDVTKSIERVTTESIPVSHKEILERLDMAKRNTKDVEMVVKTMPETDALTETKLSPEKSIPTLVLKPEDRLEKSESPIADVELSLKDKDKKTDDTIKGEISKEVTVKVPEDFTKLSEKEIDETKDVIEMESPVKSVVSVVDTPAPEISKIPKVEEDVTKSIERVTTESIPVSHKEILERLDMAVEQTVTLPKDIETEKHVEKETKPKTEKEIQKDVEMVVKTMPETDALTETKLSPEKSIPTLVLKPEDRLEKSESPIADVELSLKDKDKKTDDTIKGDISKEVTIMVPKDIITISEKEIDETRDVIETESPVKSVVSVVDTPAPEISKIPKVEEDVTKSIERVTTESIPVSHKEILERLDMPVEQTVTLPKDIETEKHVEEETKPKTEKEIQKDVEMVVKTMPETDSLTETKLSPEKSIPTLVLKPEDRLEKSESPIADVELSLKDKDKKTDDTIKGDISKEVTIMVPKDIITISEKEIDETRDVIETESPVKSVVSVVDTPAPEISKIPKVEEDVTKSIERVTTESIPVSHKEILERLDMAVEQTVTLPKDIETEKHVEEKTKPKTEKEIQKYVEMVVKTMPETDALTETKLSPEKSIPTLVPKPEDRLEKSELPTADVELSLTDEDKKIDDTMKGEISKEVTVKVPEDFTKLSEKKIEETKDLVEVEPLVSVVDTPVIGMWKTSKVEEDITKFTESATTESVPVSDKINLERLDMLGKETVTLHKDHETEEHFKEETKAEMVKEIQNDLEMVVKTMPETDAFTTKTSAKETPKPERIQEISKSIDAVAIKDLHVSSREIDRETVMQEQRKITLSKDLDSKKEIKPVPEKSLTTVIQAEDKTLPDIDALTETKSSPEKSATLVSESLDKAFEKSDETCRVDRISDQIERTSRILFNSDEIDSEELTKVLKKFFVTENISVVTDTKETTEIVNGITLQKKSIITITKETLKHIVSFEKVTKITTETTTKIIKPNGRIETLSDIKISVSDSEHESLAEELTEYYMVGLPNIISKINKEIIMENDLYITKTITTTIRKRLFLNNTSNTKKLRTTVTKITINEHPSGATDSYTIEKTFAVNVDSNLSQFYINQFEVYDEIIEGTSMKTDVEEKQFEDNGVVIKRTITTKTVRETLLISLRNVKLLRTTIEITTQDNYPDGSSKIAQEQTVTTKPIDALDSFKIDVQSGLTGILSHEDSSEDVSRDMSLEEKHSFEGTEKELSQMTLEKEKDYSEKLSLSSAVQHDKTKMEVPTEDSSEESPSKGTKPDSDAKRGYVLPDIFKEVELPSVDDSSIVSDVKNLKPLVHDIATLSKEEIPYSDGSDSGVHSIVTDSEQLILESQSQKSFRDEDTYVMMEKLQKVFSSEEPVQQGIKTEDMSSFAFSLDRVSTPPTVPVSPLPKTPSGSQEIKSSEGMQSEITYDKVNGAEEVITKIVHVGDDVLTQKISTSTEKLPKTVKSSFTDSESDADIIHLMETVGKIKTETDTVTKVIKEGQNVVTQTITTVTTKEVISRDDGTPQNIKTTIETTTLSKSSDGSTKTTKDTQTLLTECSSSLKSTSRLELYAKEESDGSVGYSETSDKIEKAEPVSGDQKPVTHSELSTKEHMNVEHITFDTSTSDTEDNIEDTTIDTDVTKRIIKENGIDVVETITTVTKKETVKVSDTKKIIKTTVETETTLERPNGSKDIQRNVEVKTEEIIEDDQIDIETLLSKFVVEGEPQESETVENIEVEIKNILIQREIVTKIVKTVYSCDTRKKLKTVTTVTTTDRYPDGSSEIKIETSTSINDIIENDMLIDGLSEYTILENKSISTDVQEKIINKKGNDILQKITITTTKELLRAADVPGKKIKTTTETVTETRMPDGIIELTKDIKVSISDYNEESDSNKLEGYKILGEPEINTSTNTEIIKENDVVIQRTITTTTIKETFENSVTNSKKSKITVRTEIQDKYPDGTIISKTSETVSISDIDSKRLLTSDLDFETDDSYMDENETIEDTSVETDVKEIVEQGHIKIKRTITTKTKRDTLTSLDENVKRVRTTVETTTVDEYPDGSTETTKDVKITISEFQKTSDSDLQAALQGLKPTGKVKNTVNTTSNTIVDNGETIEQKITIYVTKEELKHIESEEIAVKTVTETITESTKQDGSVETTKDVRTQITYLPLGTGLDDWSPEELEEIEKQPIEKEHKPIGPDLPFTKQAESQQDESKPSKTKQKSPIGEITTDTETYTKVIKEGDNEITQTVTVVTTKEVISPEKIKVTVETTTVSKGSDGVVKTTKSTKTTISEVREEFEEIIDTGESEKSFSKYSSKTCDLHSSSAASDEMDHQGISSPPSDISSGQGSRAATHVWGTESSGMYYSDDEGPGSPSSTKSQLAHSPAHSNLSFEMDSTKVVQQTEEPICGEQHIKYQTSSSECTGLPEDYSRLTEIKKETLVQEKSTMKLTKEFLLQEKDHSSSVKTSDATFLKEADEHFQKAIEEHKKVSGPEVISNVTAKYEFDKHSKSSSKFESMETKDENLMILKDIKSELKKCSESSKSTSKASSSTSSSKSEEKIETRYLSDSKNDKVKDPIESWGKPLGLPSPVQPNNQSDGKSTPKKQMLNSTVLNKNKINQEKSKDARNAKPSESPSKKKNPAPVYLDLTYVPHHGNSYYSAVEFFKRVRARYYVFSGTEPSKEIYNALLDAKKTWEDKDLEVTIIPTYDTDVLGYWVTENEEALEKYKIDLSPSASRCTINLQDHETSCAAYRLEF